VRGCVHACVGACVRACIHNSRTELQHEGSMATACAPFALYHCPLGPAVANCASTSAACALRREATSLWLRLPRVAAWSRSVASASASAAAALAYRRCLIVGTGSAASIAAVASSSSRRTAASMARICRSASASQSEPTGLMLRALSSAPSILSRRLTCTYYMPQPQPQPPRCVRIRFR
jgi:hypothetical protein